MKILTNKRWREINDTIAGLIGDYNAMSTENKRLKGELQLKKQKIVTMPSYIPNYWQMSITNKHEKTLKKWEKEIREEMNGVLDSSGQKKVDGKVRIELIYYK